MSEYETLLESEDVRAYLAAQGWLQRGLIDREVELWAPPANDESDIGSILVPLHRNWDGYARRLRDAVLILATWQRRSVEAVGNEIRRSLEDVFRFVRTGNDIDGTIDLEQGVGLVRASELVMRSAAVTATNPVRVIPSRVARDVKDFMSSLRLDQTERSSYVVKVIAPQGTLQPEESELGPRVDAPFSRLVGLGLATSLAATRDALDEAHQFGTLAGFTSRVGNGISANLLDALAGPLNTPAAAESAMKISITWSNARAAPKGAATDFVYRRADRGILVDAAGLLRREPSNTPITVVGMVDRLQSDNPDEHGAIGIIAGGRRYTVGELNAADYQKALRAHESGLQVIVEGTFERRGNHSYIRDPRDLRPITTLLDD